MCTEINLTPAQVQSLIYGESITVDIPELASAILITAVIEGE